MPKVVTPGTECNIPPSDAVILFSGKNLDDWVTAKDGSPAKWIIADGVVTVNLGQVSTGYRILSFLGLGLLMLGTSVLYGKLSPKLLKTMEATEAI